MKRKSPPTSLPRTYKRRRLSSPKKYSNILSPTTTKSSPRPSQILTQNLQNRRLLQQSKKIDLTDDEENIIYEENENDDIDINSPNEIEIARGTNDNNDIDYDPFADIDYDIIKVNKPQKDDNNNTDISQFQLQTIPDLEPVLQDIEDEDDVDSENRAPVPIQRLSVSVRNKSPKRIKKRKGLTLRYHVENDYVTDTDYDRIQNDELNLSQNILSQHNKYNISDKSDDMTSLDLDINDNQNQISKAIKDLQLIEDDHDYNVSPIQIQTHASSASSLSPINIGKDLQLQEIEIEMDQDDDQDQLSKSLSPIERSVNAEDEEKQMELSDDQDVNLPQIQSQEIILKSITNVSNDQTIYDIDVREPQPAQTKTYSVERKKRRKQHIIHKSKRIVNDKRKQIKAKEMESMQYLTPMSRDLAQKINKRFLKPTTRTRRKEKQKQVQIQIQQDQDDDEERQREIEERRRKQARRERSRERIKARKGSSYSLLNEFLKRKKADDDGSDDSDDSSDSSDDVDEDDVNMGNLYDKREIERMMLTQSGMNQEWKEIEKKRKKRKKIQKKKKKKLKTKNKFKKRKKKVVLDKDFINRSKPKISKELADKYEEKQNKLIGFWRDIENKMKNNEFIDDMVTFDEYYNNKENIGYISNRRALTPPRIHKLLDRRYRKQYENATGDIVRPLYDKPKGKRVWFLNQKQDILLDKQRERMNNDWNNSLISVTPVPSLQSELDAVIPVPSQESLQSASPLGIQSQQSLQIIQPRIDDDISIDERQSIADIPSMSMSTISSISTIAGGDNQSLLSSIPEWKESDDDDDNLLFTGNLSVGGLGTLPIDKPRTTINKDLLDNASVSSDIYVQSVGSLSMIMEENTKKDISDHDQSISDANDPFIGNIVDNIGQNKKDDNDNDQINNENDLGENKDLSQGSSSQSMSINSKSSQNSIVF